MVVQVVAGLLAVLAALSSRSGSSSAPDPELGRLELQRVRSLAAQPRYGECWARALDKLDTRCKDLTSKSQSRIALRFTLCHLSSSGRDIPSCPEGSEVSRCTGAMDAVAFNTYTEFFTHTHSMCHFLQAEAWQSRAENTIHRLTESSEGVAEQLHSTKQLAEDLIDAQSAALEIQQEMLTNGEELRVTLKDSTQGLRAVFMELSSVSREQQVALSELFNRVSFLQNFLMMEAHSLSSCFYNAAALITAFLLTSTQRSSRARLVLLSLVCLNFYLERKIYQFVVSSEHPEHRHMELLADYVSVLRRFMVCVGLCVLLYVCARYRDPMQQSLQLLQQLKETQRGLQEALQRAESLGELQVNRPIESRGREEVRMRRKEMKTEQEEMSRRKHVPDTTDLLHLSDSGWSYDSTVNISAADITMQPQSILNASVHSPTTHIASMHNPTTHNASVHSPTPHNTTVRPGGHHSSSPLVYRVMLEEKRSRYSLRSRRSDVQ